MINKILIILILMPSVLVGLDNPKKTNSPKVIRLAPDQCHYFGLFSYTNAEFIGLVSNGEYVRINREHMFVEQSDSGTWNQREDGIVILHSRDRFHVIEFGPLSFYVGKDPSLETVRKIKSALIEFLQQYPDQEFLPDEVSGIGRDRKYCSDDPFFGDISVDAETEYEKMRVLRSDLEGLLQEMNEFETANDKNEFRFIPLKYKRWVFLEWKNSEISIARDRNQIVEELEKLKKNEMPPFFYVEISRTTFEKEAATTQPFMFYPEMNKDRPAATETTEKITAPCPPSKPEDH